MAAPFKNTNSIKNGSRICRVILGNWPAALNRVQRFTRQYRELLEQEVVARHDSVDVMAAHWVDAACQHEATRQVCRWILRERWTEMDPADIERNAKAMADSTDKRNAAVARLGLDTPDSDPWSILDASRPETADSRLVDESLADKAEPSGESDTPRLI